MAYFEGYDRRIKQIEACLAKYGFSDLDQMAAYVKEKGVDAAKVVREIQPIAFENAVWAYTLGAGIALKKGCKTAAQAAEAIGEGLASKGVDYKLFHMATADRNDVLAYVLQSKGVIIGSPTLNNGLLPTITPILEDLRGLGFKNKVGAAFGSFGWSGECIKEIEAHLERCKIPVVAPGVRAKWQPTGEDLQACRQLGSTTADAILKD